jgi:predicted acylesterase/phospholipase RssA
MGIKWWLGRAHIGPPTSRLGSIGWFDFHRASDAIAIGALAAERALEPIADAITSLSTLTLPNAG